MFAGGGGAAAKLALHDIGALFFETSGHEDKKEQSDDTDIVFAYQPATASEGHESHRNPSTRQRRTSP